MDAVNAIIHLFAAIGFGGLGYLYIQEQRKARRVVRLAQWALNPESAPNHSSAKLGEFLRDLCQLLGVAYDGEGVGESSPQIIRVKYWLLLLRSGQVTQLEQRPGAGRTEIHVLTKGAVVFSSDEQRKYFEEGEKTFIAIFKSRGDS